MSKTVVVIQVKTLHPIEATDNRLYDPLHHHPEHDHQDVELHPAVAETGGAVAQEAQHQLEDVDGEQRMLGNFEQRGVSTFD